MVEKSHQGSVVYLESFPIPGFQFPNNSFRMQLTVSEYMVSSFQITVSEYHRDNSCSCPSLPCDILWTACGCGADRSDEI